MLMLRPGEVGSISHHDDTATVADAVDDGEEARTVTTNLLGRRRLPRRRQRQRVQRGR
jgi:hypothetical protein